MSPALGDEAQYMARRSLGLLLTGGSNSEARGGRISFNPVAANGSPVFFRKVVHLLNVWNGLNGLAEAVLPFMSAISKWETTRLVCDPHAVRPYGTIDWAATFRSWSLEPRIVVKDRRRTEDDVSHAFIAIVLTEIFAHADEVLSYFRAALNPDDPLNAFVEDIELRTKGINTRLADGPWNNCRPDSKTVGRIREHFRSDFAQDAAPSLFPTYESAIRDLVRDTQEIWDVNEGCRRLRLWRKQYFRGEVWLADKAGFDLSLGSHDGLFELFCFAELLLVARSLNLRKFPQESFIRKGRDEPEFMLQSSFYAYFNFNQRRFITARGEDILSGVKPTIPGAHVEWFIRNTSEYRMSIVLDTKHSAWRSEEALKVLGYMGNFGVRQGAVVFSGSLAPLERYERPVVPGLFRLACPMQEDAFLWVLQIRPHVEAEGANNRVLTEFLSRSVCAT